MNTHERKLVGLLKRIKGRGHLVSVKAEFEAEGTRVDELLRLLDVIRCAETSLTLKIGGCEALKDLFEARQFGASFIVAPMIESPYALSKYSQIVNRVYREDEQKETSFLFNLETVTAFEKWAEIRAVALDLGNIDGVVFGRSDFSGSLGIKGHVNERQVVDAAVSVASSLSDTDLEFVVGGAVSISSVPELREIASEKLSRFETRKIVFPASSLQDELLEESLLDAVHFEILWLINKREYYGAIVSEDEARIRQLEDRWGVLQREV